MKNDIRVFSPATISNVGCGYDIMGFALKDLGEEMVVRKTENGGLKIDKISGDESIPFDPQKNTATVAVKAMLAQLPNVDFGFSFEMYKNILPGSGLGTSASSSVAAVYAVNELLGRPFNKTELVQFAMEGEKIISGKAHADNVAPTALGGFVVISSYDPFCLLTIPHPDFYVSIVHPQIEIKTSEARKLLGDTIPLNKAVTQWGNVAGLVAGLCTNDLNSIGRSIRDVVAEPVRSVLIPEYSDVKKAAYESGALGCNISGSGPSIFAISKTLSTAEEVTKAMLKPYTHVNISARGYTTSISQHGVSVI